MAGPAFELPRCRGRACATPNGRPPRALSASPIRHDRSCLHGLTTDKRSPGSLRKHHAATALLRHYPSAPELNVDSLPSLDLSFPVGAECRPDCTAPSDVPPTPQHPAPSRENAPLRQ